MKSKISFLKPLILLLLFAVTFGVFSLLISENNTYAYAELENEEITITDFTVSVTVQGTSTRLYGEKINLIATFSRAREEGETVSYQWYKAEYDEENEPINTMLEGKTASILVVENVIDSGEYFCEVTLEKGGTNLSRTSGVQKVTINPREVEVRWLDLDNLIYNGQLQFPIAEAMGVNMYSIELELEGGGIDAGTDYEVTASTKDTNYILRANSITRSFSIKPLEVSVVWSEDNAQFVYNGTPQAPTAVAYGVNDYVIPVTVNGASINARYGQSNYYTAVAVINQTNYVLKTSTTTTRFTILPFETEVVWESLELVYNGSAQRPQAVAKGVNDYNIPLDYIGSGTDVVGGPYEIWASTKDPNYKLNNAIKDFVIIPLEVDVVWMIPKKIEYDTRDQSNKIIARFMRTDGSESPLIVNIEDNKIFRNAGTYWASASMPITIQNYSLKPDTTKRVQVTIHKATPTIIVNNKNPIFNYSGEAVKIEAELSNGEPLQFYEGSRRVDNSFIEPGRYQITITSSESSNYLPATPVRVSLVIKEINYSTVGGDIEGKIQLTNGNDPEAVLVIDKIDVKNFAYQEQWARSVSSAFLIYLQVDDDSIAISAPGVLTFKLPKEYEKLEKVRILTPNGGEYIEQIVENKDGYVTITVYESGTYAITQVNETLLLIWWVAIGAIAVLVLLIIIVYFSRKRERIG